MGLDPHIVVSRGRGFGSTVICWWLKGPASHISWTLNKEDIRFNVGAGAKGGLEWEEVHMWKKQNHILAVIRPKINLDTELTAFIQKYLESEYDYWSASATGIKHRLPWLWRLLGDDVLKKASDIKFQCTESISGPLRQQTAYTALKNIEASSFSVTNYLHVLLDKANANQFEVLWMSETCKKWATKQKISFQLK